MSFLHTLAIAMGSSWVSGINLYAAVATLGLLGRFAGLKLPGDMGILSSWWVIGVALGLYAIEFFADKISLSAHGTKASARVAINTSPEPVSNIAASVAEDIVAVAAVVLAWLYPTLVIALVVAGVIVSLLIVPRIVRYIRTLSARIRRVSGF